MRSKSHSKHNGSGDSIWGVILSWAKAFNTTFEHVLYDMSYLNCIMYSSAMPLYDDEEDMWDDRLDANNPDNFDDNDEDIYVR